MEKWTLIDHNYGQKDDGTESTIDSIGASIKDKVDDFISNAELESNDVRLIICEGDSWFGHYTWSSHNAVLGSIFKILQEKDKLNNNNAVWGVVDIAAAGDTLRDIVKYNEELKTILEHDNVKCVLLSAGGNDIIEELDILLNQDGLNQTSVNVEMEKIKTRYTDIVNVVNDKNIPIFTHSYAYFCNFGECGSLTKLSPKCPWIANVMKNNNLSKEDTYNALADMLDLFYFTINNIDGITIADTRNSLGVKYTHKKSLWHDEIHPTKTASNKVAKIYVDKILETQSNLLT